MTFQPRGFSRTSRSVSAPIGQVLSEDQLRQFVPSVFALEKHESRSERYTYIPTIEAVRGLQREGFMPVFATQGRSRIPGKTDFTKHLLRFRQDVRGERVLNQEYKEVVLINSHDGTSSYILHAGVFKLICLNGMVVGEKFEELRVGHKGDIVNEVIEGTFEIVDQFGRVDESIEEMKQIRLNRDEMQILGETALQIRFDDPKRKPPITVEQINAPRRPEDVGNDLWTSFNRVQENAIRGGVEASVLNPKTNRWGRRTTREIQGVDQLVGVNRALWTMAERMAELKKAA